MSIVRIPWGAWYGDRDMALSLPGSWHVIMPEVPEGPVLGPEELRQAMAQPVGTRPIRECARGKKRPVVVIDDLTRPTPASELLPLVLEEFAAAGIDRGAVRLLTGVAGHRPMTRQDLLKKLGPLADELEVINHTPYENLVFLGETSAGTPIWINRFYVEADFRVTIGCVEPHPTYGFSGGAKLVFPGVAGIESMYANHRPHHLGRGILGPDARAMRLDAEEAVRRVGLDVIVNVVIAGGRRLAGVFVGDFVTAHRSAAAFAEQLYRTPVAEPADVVIFNAYPKDTELIQVNNALNAALASRVSLLREGGVVVITTAASEGAGHHALAGPGARMNDRPAHAYLEQRRVVAFCPHGRAADLPPSIPRGSTLFRNWPEVIQEIERHLGSRLSVLILKEGPLQIPAPAAPRGPALERSRDRQSV